MTDFDKIRDVVACEECRLERAAGGMGPERQLRSTFAIGNAEVCDACLRLAFALPLQLLDAAVEHTGKLAVQRDALKVIADAARRYLDDPEWPLDEFVKIVRTFEKVSR